MKRDTWLPWVVVVVALLGSVTRAPAVGCDDGDACTTGDTCNNGVCMGTPVHCADDGDACTDEFCNPATGACALQAKGCSDRNPCTTDGCNSSIGCTHTNVADTTACDDGSDCSTGDECSGGTCVGMPVSNGTACGGTSGTCQAECQGGICDRTVNNGELCDDGLTCTTGDTCASAECVGQSTCTGINPCAVASCADTGCAAIDKCPAAISECAQFGACNETTGECLTTPINEGQSCSDSNSCTVRDQCMAGLCQGTALGVEPERGVAALSAPWLVGLAAALSAFAVFRVQMHRRRS